MAVDMLHTTIGDLLDDQAARVGERDALIHVEHAVRLTYAAFRDTCDRMARGLLALGVQKGEHVGIWATNYPEWVIAQFATAKIGAVLVTVNPAYRTHELAYLLQQSDTSTLLLIGRYRSSDYVGMLRELIPELASSPPGRLQSAVFPRLKRVIYIGTDTPAGMLSWQQVASMGDHVDMATLQARQRACQPDDVINIQYT